MKIIPKQYHELELIFEAINRIDARCITFASPNGKEGTTSLAVSVAKRLNGRNERVLLIDLNTCSPISKEQLINIPKELSTWSFGDISCQLNTQCIDDFHFLSITQLQDLALVREKDVFEMAILMLLQEFDYILFETSPLCNKNHANFPLHLLLSMTDLVLLDVALGKTSQAALDQVVNELKAAKCKRFEIVVSQTFMPPLGSRLVTAVERKCRNLPKLKRRLTNYIEKQAWLFQGV